MPDSPADMPSMLRAGHGLILIVLALLTIGVVMVNSAGLSIDVTRGVDLQSVLLGRLTILAVLAVGALAIGCWFPVHALYSATRWTAPVAWIVAGCVALLLLVHVPGLGREVNGAKRWISIQGLSFQPSELAKWGLLIVIAWYATRHVSRMNRFAAGFLPPILLIILICALIAKEDLGTAVLIGIVGLVMLLAGGARLWHAAMLAPAAALGFLAAVIQSPYRIDRLKAFLDPYADAQGIGYHMIQSMAAVSAGGLAGRGLGNSIHKFGYLPEDTTDFIFAIICEELGAVGAAVIVALYLALLLCGLHIVRSVRHPFQRLLGLGIVLTIGLQAVINIAVVTGAAPTKGIALPLLSSGGTGWVLTAFCIGLLVSMERAALREASEEFSILETPTLTVEPAATLPA